jgi:hypothetical protein
VGECRDVEVPDDEDKHHGGRKMWICVTWKAVAARRTSKTSPSTVVAAHKQRPWDIWFGQNGHLGGGHLVPLIHHGLLIFKLDK